MAKILIIPDVHGRTFWRYATEHTDEFDKIVFLGDYLDPYPHENIGFNEAVFNFEDIIEFKQNNEEKVILLLGNHDLHYYDLNFMDCSRLNYKYRDRMHMMFKEFKDYFQLVYEYDKYLFSHAGVYDLWLKDHELTVETLKDPKFLEANIEDLEDLSGLRGGYKVVGSCVWADIRESQWYNLENSHYHIVGHTQLTKDPYITDDVACLDCRQPFMLNTDTGNIISVYEIN